MFIKQFKSFSDAQWHNICEVFEKLGNVIDIEIGTDMIVHTMNESWEIRKMTNDLRTNVGVKGDEKEVFFVQSICEIYCPGIFLIESPASCLLQFMGHNCLRMNNGNIVYSLDGDHIQIASESFDQLSLLLDVVIQTIVNH